MMLAVFKVSPIVATEVNVKSILIVLRYPFIIRKTFSAGASDGKYSWCRQNILYDDDSEEI